MNKNDSDYILRHLILKRAKKVLVTQATKPIVAQKTTKKEIS